MSGSPLLVWTDTEFLANVDEAFADAAKRSGDYLACRPGCNQCCTGTFAISMLDAHRLRNGYLQKQSSDAEGYARLRLRIEDSVERLKPDFPGDPLTGILFDDETSCERFEDFGNDEVCPVLDPETGTCDLYAARPMTCRLFGPPVRTDDGLGVCELCFQGATAREVAVAEMFLPPPEIEAALTAPLGGASTIVAFALAASEILDR